MLFSFLFELHKYIGLNILYNEALFVRFNDTELGKTADILYIHYRRL